MSHIPALRIDVHVIYLGFSNQRNCLGRDTTHTTAVTVNSKILCAFIHSQAGKLYQNGYLFVIALMFPPAGAMSSETVTVEDIRGFSGKYLEKKLMLTFAKICFSLWFSHGK